MTGETAEVIVSLVLIHSSLGLMRRVVVEVKRENSLRNNMD